ncbi:MAG: ArsC family reductase [Gammaproteobacteria bacterium]|uniref:ArsC family reductase n=1 Tax=Rhodoferax sp. TaxID=50421 RepID=UPI0017CB2859|nr:ArsC family reductase [Rhodoferax sp.]MBU3898941.1 ArsC family reductase [Gammaproteobacteria bacterium]MBA3059288.1 ArsC family reductase [Rhodoferax sp.]MBU3997510.1 ArsC family reductase [Gammaproteobacteria bacterium]MBU4018384.1 ArsC family reductase [Gammaproteobacteria bacterium]MBU4080397.1 ArsC family reductase [Gammaproteobacteria bacterium]
MRGMNTLATASSSSSALMVFGIANCDTVKKARSWLTEHGVSHVFHDFKKLGVPAELLPGWIAAVGWEPLLNRKGTTWRKLDPSIQADVIDADSAVAVIKSNPSVVKRPVVAWPNGQITVGFDATQWLGLIA